MSRACHRVRTSTSFAHLSRTRATTLKKSEQVCVLVDPGTAAFSRAKSGLRATTWVEQLKFKLDLWLSYLRDAFHTCYYSYLLADSREELHQHSIQYFRRRPADAAPSPPLRFRSSSAADGGEKGTDEPEKEDVKMKEVEPALKSNKWKVVSEVVEEEKKPEVAEEDPILEDGQPSSAVFSLFLECSR